MGIVIQVVTRSQALFSWFLRVVFPFSGESLRICPLYMHVGDGQYEQTEQTNCKRHVRKAHFATRIRSAIRQMHSFGQRKQQKKNR